MKKILSMIYFCALAFGGGGGVQAQTLPLSQPVVSGAVTVVQQAGDTRTSEKFAADCAAGVGLSNCVAPSTPNNCPAGKHWSSAGSGIAHCVADDPVCLSPNTLQHDALGNPSCVAPVITYDTQYRTLSCASGYEGAGTDQQRTVTYTNGVPSYGAWTTVNNDCTAIPSTPTPPPTCANGASDYPTCTPPYTPPPPPPPPTPTCANGASDYPTCTPPYTPPPTCANGASNYPTCTFPPPPPPPPPPSCPATMYSCGFEQLGVIKMTIYTTTFSGPSCTANTTTQTFYVDEPDCPY